MVNSLDQKLEQVRQSFWLLNIAKSALSLDPSRRTEPQTDEMRARKLQLVIPKSLHETFRPSQQNWLISLDEFIGLVEERQSAAPEAS